MVIIREYEVVIIRDCIVVIIKEYGGYHMYWLFYGGLLGNVDCCERLVVCGSI